MLVKSVAGSLGSAHGEVLKYSGVPFIGVISGDQNGTNQSAARANMPTCSSHRA